MEGEDDPRWAIGRVARLLLLPAGTTCTFSTNVSLPLIFPFHENHPLPSAPRQSNVSFPTTLVNLAQAQPTLNIAPRGEAAPAPRESDQCCQLRGKIKRFTRIITRASWRHRRTEPHNLGQKNLARCVNQFQVLMGKAVS